MSTFLLPQKRYRFCNEATYRLPVWNFHFIILIFGSCAGGFIVFYKNGFIHWPYAVAMALGSTVGSQIGILALPKIPTKIAKYLLNLIICLLIIQMLIEII
ncbi:TSUP family transporter [Bacillus smithii]|uniref:TSUP family transporter n=1 Tax=Bacillus smithii TaxID=1479 RepID=UPI00399C90EE